MEGFIVNAFQQAPATPVRRSVALVPRELAGFPSCANSCTADVLAEMCSDLTTVDNIIACAMSQCNASDAATAVAVLAGQCDEQTTATAVEVLPATAVPTYLPGSLGPPTSTKSVVGPVVGGTIGGLVLLAIISFVIWRVIRKDRLAARQAEDAEVGSNDDDSMRKQSLSSEVSRPYVLSLPKLPNA